MNGGDEAARPTGDENGPQLALQGHQEAMGLDGKFFDFPTAATFEAETDALAYAERFAAAQTAAGVSGARVVVRTLGGRDVAGFWVGARPTLVIR